MGRNTGPGILRDAFKNCQLNDRYLYNRRRISRGTIIGRTIIVVLKIRALDTKVEIWTE